MALSQQPRYPVSLTIDGKKMPFTIQFDVNDNQECDRLHYPFDLSIRYDNEGI